MLSTIKADLKANTGHTGLARCLAALFYSPGFFAVCLYRAGRSLRQVPIVGHFAATVTWRINVLLTSCYIHTEARIQPGLSLPHPTGIVVGEGVSIGRNVTIYQNVTLGVRDSNRQGYPVIEENCVIYSNAVIAGGITVGAASTIGANAVVLFSAPPNSTCVGNPGRLLKRAN